MKYRVAIKGIVVNSKGKILLLREDEGWDFPGGGLEYPESPSGCLSREIKEELGVDVESIDNQPLYIHSSEYLRKGEISHQITLFYKSKLARDEIKLEVDIYEYKYFSLEDIDIRKLHNKFKDLDLKKLVQLQNK